MRLCDCIREIPSYKDRESYISDVALSSSWEDDPESDVPQERLEMLAKLWDALTAETFKGFMSALDIRRIDVARRFGIPLRTVENWCSESRIPPKYLLHMMAEILIYEQYKNSL